MLSCTVLVLHTNVKQTIIITITKHTSIGVLPSKNKALCEYCTHVDDYMLNTVDTFN